MITTEATNVKDFQDFIKAELTKRGWSQTQLAERAGVARSAISKALRDDNPTRPDPVTLARLAEALRVDYLSLVALTEPDISGIDAETRLMAQEFARLSPAQRRAVRAMLMGFALDSDDEEA